MTAPSRAAEVVAALACGDASCRCAAAVDEGQGKTHCPSHDDPGPSLNVTDKAGRLLVKCFATCTQASVLAALRERGLMNGGPLRTEAMYDYVDAHGTLLFRVVRFAGKDFRQCRPDGNGGWIWNLTGVRRVLYRLPDVLAAARERRRVYVVEGEKDADRMAALGLTATTSPQGAGKWRDEYADAMRGAEVVVIADRDNPGRAHAATVARSCLQRAIPVKVIELPGENVKDASDWIAAGATAADLGPLVEVAPAWKQTGDPAARTWTVADLIQAAEANPPAAIVAGIGLAAGDCYGIIAFAGVGKSQVGLDLALSLPRGKLFLDHFATTTARVGYVDEESAPVRLGQRLASLAAGHGVNLETDALPVFQVVAGVRLDVDEGVDGLFAWVQEHNLDVLIIDTLRRVHRLKENEADDMAKVERAMKELQRRAREQRGRPLTLVLLLHAPKPRTGGSNAPETMARGSSDIIAWLDGALYLRTKGRGTIEVEHAKSRWSEQVDPFLVMIQTTPTTLRLTYDGAVPTRQTRAQELRDLITNALTATPDGLTKSEILERAAKAGFTRGRTVQDELRGMVRAALLIEQQSGRAKVFKLGAHPADEDAF